MDSKYDRNTKEAFNTIKLQLTPYKSEDKKFDYQLVITIHLRRDSMQGPWDIVEKYLTPGKHKFTSLDLDSAKLKSANGTY